MKLLYTIHSANPAGGGVIEAVSQFAHAHRKMGDEVDVISLDAPTAPWLESVLPGLQGLGRNSGPYGYTDRLIPWIRERQHTYDAVIVNGLWQFHGHAVREALRGSDTPYFVFPHGMLDPWFRKAYPWKHWKKQLYWWLRERFVLSEAAAVFFTTEEERLLARDAFHPYCLNEAVVNLGTTVPFADTQAQTDSLFARFPELRGRRILLFLGRLHEKKGCDLLLRAFAETCGTGPITAQSGGPFHLLMAGPCEDEAYLARLKRLAGSLLPDPTTQVTWPGMLQGDLKWGAFRAAEAFVLPSHQENFGFSVVEALACGTPVLISNKVNIWREIVEDGAGIVGSDDVAGAIDLLKRWTQKTPEERAAMKQNARRCFQIRFDAEAAAANLRTAIETARRVRSRGLAGIRRASTSSGDRPCIKINLILPHQLPFPPIRGGGVENLNWVLAREFARRGHEVVAYSRTDRRLPNREVDEYGIRHVRVRGYDLSPIRMMDILNALRYTRNLAPVLEEASVSSFHTPFSFLLQRSLNLGAITHTLHRTPKWPVPLFRRLDRVYCGSDAVVNQARKIDPKIRNLKRVYNCVVLPDSKAPSPQTTGETGLRFLYVGRFVPDKGVFSLIEGFRQSLRNWPRNRLETIGPQLSDHGASTSFFRQMTDYVSRYSLAQQVVFHPPEFERERLDAKIREADVVCVPSLSGETFSMAILEAMALSKPVLVSDFSPMPEAVDHLRTGYVARAGDPVSIAAGIDFFSNLPATELGEMGEAGFEKAKKSFSVETIAGEYLEDFEDLAGRPRTRGTPDSRFEIHR